MSESETNPGVAGPVLDITALEVNFPVYGGMVKALNRVTLRVGNGEIVGLVGESGSGKSVTAMMVMGLLPKGSFQVAGGGIRVLDRDILQAGEAEMRTLRGSLMSMIFQEPMTALNPTRRIGRQMCEVIRLHQRLPLPAAKRRAITLLQEMHIADAAGVMERYPFELSGGMRQRVLIAMAFSCEPQLIIADEPTTALDVTVQRQVLLLLQRKARASGTAVLFITHDMAVVSQLCDRVYVMYAGTVVESGPTAQVIRQPAHPYTRGLINATPEGAIPRSPLPAIPGTVPDLTQLPPGCAFRDRCRYGDDQCQRRPAPDTFLTADGQQAACWHPQYRRLGEMP
ncbi:ABC transporter ATP-binding protein [Sodalis sp. dw_96]|uniref:ABC transporter ATP-binding protein n=1 Tax=Sodalis sp. dw_96 TaxID=2719794 RepID=UPI001BD6D57A|nr:ABC transporter ATP-binding protein [Sodalis sp. dw_96]